MTNEMKSKIIYKISKQKKQRQKFLPLFLEIQTYERLL